MLACRYGAEAIGRLEAIGWDQTGELYALDGERIAEQHGEAFAGLTVAGAATAATTEGADLPRLRRALGDDSHATPPEQLVGFWRFALGRLVLAALHRDGWTIQSPPGEPLVCRRGDDVIEVYRALARATEDALSASEWQGDVRAPRRGRPAARAAACRRRRDGGGIRQLDGLRRAARPRPRRR